MWLVIPPPVVAGLLKPDILGHVHRPGTREIEMCILSNKTVPPNYIRVQTLTFVTSLCDRRSHQPCIGLIPTIRMTHGTNVYKEIFLQALLTMISYHRYTSVL